MRNSMKDTREYLRSQKIIKRRKQQAMRRFILLCIFVVLLLILFLSSFHLKAIRIQTIEVEGNQVIPTDQITAIAEAQLQGSDMYIFPKDSIILYPRSAIEQALLKQFPRFSSVAVHATGASTIKIFVSERKANSLWCNAIGAIDVPTTVASTSSSTSAITSQNSTDQCYFLDAQGYVFSLAPNFQGNSYLKFYGGLGGQGSSTNLTSLNSNPVGSEITASSTFFQLVELADTLQKNGLPVAYVKIIDADDFSYKLVGNGELLFADDKPFSNAVDNLLTALRSDVFVNPQSERQGTTTADPFAPKQIAQFVYIDTRFGNKIFFKLKSSMTTSTSTNATTSSTIVGR